MNQSNTAEDIFNKLNPVKWKYNDKLDLGDKTHFGFIAQELQELGDDFSFVDDTGEYLKVNYNEFIGIMVSVMKQQQLDINKLKSDIKLLGDNNG